MRSRVDSQIIPRVAVGAANQTFSPCQRRRTGQLGVDHYIAKILASTYVIALTQPSATGLQLHLNSGLSSSEIFNIRLTQFG